MTKGGRQAAFWFEARLLVIQILLFPIFIVPGFELGKSSQSLLLKPADSRKVASS